MFEVGDFVINDISEYDISYGVIVKCEGTKFTVDWLFLKDRKTGALREYGMDPDEVYEYDPAQSYIYKEYIKHAPAADIAQFRLGKHETFFPELIQRMGEQ